MSRQQDGAATWCPLKTARSGGAGRPDDDVVALLHCSRLPFTARAAAGPGSPMRPGGY